MAVVLVAMTLVSETINPLPTHQNSLIMREYVTKKPQK